MKLGEFELNKVYCMDCLKGLEKIPHNSVDLVVTSPPYNIGIDYGEEGYKDNKDFNEYKSFIKKTLIECHRVLKEKGILALNVGNQRNSGIPHHYYFWLKELDFNIIKEIFWYKGLYYIQGETIFVCSKTKEYNCYYKKNDGFYSNGQFSTVWQMRYNNQESRKKLNHNAFFVLQLPKNFISINTKEGDIILDPFMGSGTVALASKQLKRNFIGFEINPEYVKIANKRLAQETLT
jgi:site-specific DNA-methyltransferase (adenine-specific)